MNSTVGKLAVDKLALAALLCCIGAQAAPLKKENLKMTPALEHYSQSLVLGELWQRPGLSPRDRSIVTLAALVTNNQAHELPFYLRRALDSGVKPGEIAELITQLAFHAGWPRVFSAMPVFKDVFAQRTRKE